MKRIENVVIASVLLGLAAGCSPIDPNATVYGSPQRIGIAAVTYMPVIAESDILTDTLGFDSSSGVELSYAMPLKPGFDLKIAIDLSHWPVKLHPIAPQVEATWDQTGLMFLLRGGWKWGRFGAHYAAGLGWLFNGLEWEGLTSDADGSLGVQTDIGFTFTVHPNVDLGLDLAYRASRGVYVRNNISHDQILEAMMLKFGINFMF